MRRLLQFIISALVVYGVLKAPGLFWGKPVPQSLIVMYMFFAVVIILLVITSTDEGTRELFSPFASLFEDPSKASIRNIVLIILPVLAAYAVYAQIRPGTEQEPELRSIHPAPPLSISAYGKRFDLASLENPLRAIEKEDPARYRGLVDEGGAVYFKNCFFCHGAKLDGAGHYARGLDPLPLAFSGKDTIAQLKESFVFWRVVKGGPGLPLEGAPWKSSMPAWEDILSEEEVWKVILFMYDQTGNVPRS